MNITLVLYPILTTKMYQSEDSDVNNGLVQYSSNSMKTSFGMKIQRVFVVKTVMTQVTSGSEVCFLFLTIGLTLLLATVAATTTSFHILYIDLIGMLSKKCIE